MPFLRTFFKGVCMQENKVDRKLIEVVMRFNPILKSRMSSKSEIRFMRRSEIVLILIE